MRRLKPLARSRSRPRSYAGRAASLWFALAPSSPAAKRVLTCCASRSTASGGIRARYAVRPRDDHSGRAPILGDAFACGLGFVGGLDFLGIRDQLNRASVTGTWVSSGGITRVLLW